MPTPRPSVSPNHRTCRDCGASGGWCRACSQAWEASQRAAQATAPHVFDAQHGDRLDGTATPALIEASRTGDVLAFRGGDQWHPIGSDPAVAQAARRAGHEVRTVYVGDADGWAADAEGPPTWSDWSELSRTLRGEGQGASVSA